MRPSRFMAVMFASLTLLLGTASGFAANAEKLVHTFNGTRGKNPAGALVFDASGNLYGVTTGGGVYGGVAFELSRNLAGIWVETVLHDFGNPKDEDGNYPLGRLVFDSSGNLYGVTLTGGRYDQGTVYELSPAGAGKWTETILHSFSAGYAVNPNDGSEPGAGLAFDAARNLYGTTAGGGNHGQGTAFELSPASNGGWKETVIWSFGSGTDGAVPEAGLTFDAFGNLYGTTELGGTQNYGAVFELSPVAGIWSEVVLYSFGASLQGGATPLSTPVFDSNGNLYGAAGGGSGYGIVFELSPSIGGEWIETVLHTFVDSDGSNPCPQQLVFDAQGNIYGTTSYGGAYTAGTVFEVSPSLGGWTETTIHSFGRLADGEFPDSGVSVDGAGNLYGATFEGGNDGDGMVYEIIP